MLCWTQAYSEKFLSPLQRLKKSDVSFVWDFSEDFLGRSLTRLLCPHSEPCLSHIYFTCLFYLWLTAIVMYSMHEECMRQINMSRSCYCNGGRGLELESISCGATVLPKMLECWLHVPRPQPVAFFGVPDLLISGRQLLLSNISQVFCYSNTHGLKQHCLRWFVTLLHMPQKCISYFVGGERIKPSEAQKVVLLWEQINHLEKESHLRVLLSEDPKDDWQHQLTTLNLCSRGVSWALTNYFQIMGRKCVCLHPKYNGNGVNIGILGI